MAFYRLKFTPEALQDIADASEYYEKQKKGLGKRFRVFLKDKLMIIKESPLIYALRYPDVRFALVEFFPYSIHFSVNQRNNIV